MFARTSSRGLKGLRPLLFLGLFAAGAVFVNGQAALGAPPNTSISTQGVVVFGEAVTGSGTNGTYRMDPDGGGLALVTTQWYPNDVSRGQSPVTVLINSGQNGVGDIYAQRADGAGAPVALLVSPTLETQLRFSPDGMQIAYGTVIQGSPNVYTISTAAVLRDEAGEVTGMGQPVVVWTGSVQTRGLDFSRDGTKIVFAAYTAGHDLFVLHLADGSVEQLTNTPEYEEYPRWSPTDDRVVYQRKTSSGSSVGSLLTIDYATGTVRTVLAGGTRLYATLPCWSPGGTHVLALVGGYKKPLDLYQFPSTGGTGVNVTGGTSLQPNTPCWGW